MCSAAIRVHIMLTVSWDTTMVSTAVRDTGRMLDRDSVVVTMDAHTHNKSQK